jgi:hypothetical protein
MSNITNLLAKQKRIEKNIKVETDINYNELFTNN